MIIRFLLSILLSTLTSYLVTPFVTKYFISKKWVEDPKKRQITSVNVTALTTVPRGGGISIFIGILVSSLLLLPLDKHLIGILIAAAVTLVVGLWDDVSDISPKIRLFTNFIAATVVVGSGIGIAYLSNPLGGVFDLSWLKINFDLFGPHSIWVLSDTIAIIWIIWCMNVTGWSAGVEGQLPGFVSITSLFIGLLGLQFAQDISQWPVIILSGAVAGAYLGFLPHNFFPQSIMPGYSGKSLAGFFLAVLSILSGAKLATLILLMAVPMIDAGYVLFLRFLGRRPLLKSDGQHLHHQLLKVGWSRVKIAVFYWSVSLILGCISVFLNSQQKLIVFVLLCFVFLFFTLTLSRRTSPKSIR